MATVCHSLQTGVVGLVESLCKTEQEVEPVDDDLVQENFVRHKEKMKQLEKSSE